MKERRSPHHHHRLLHHRHHHHCPPPPPPRPVLCPNSPAASAADPTVIIEPLHANRAVVVYWEKKTTLCMYIYIFICLDVDHVSEIHRATAVYQEQKDRQGHFYLFLF